jgi:protein-tyrosine phosphatase
LTAANTYRILMVCTGNICRSPVMERLLVARLRERLTPDDAARFVVSSVGTWAVVGAPMAREAAETLVNLGGDPTGFSARQLDVGALPSMSLILTAAREHRALVVAGAPSVADRTVTLREFAGLLAPVTRHDIDSRVSSEDPVERMSAIAAAAFEQRGLVPFEDRVPEDVPDPYGKERAAYLRAASQINAALAVPLRLLLDN